MAETILGTVAVVWGNDVGATGTGIGTFKIQSATFTAEADEATVRDGDGDTIVSIWHDQRETLTLDYIPSGANIAAAKTANIIPTPGAIVEVSSTDDSEVVGTTVGTSAYICVRATKNKSNTAANSISLELKRWKANNVAVAVS